MRVHRALVVPVLRDRGEETRERFRGRLPRDEKTGIRVAGAERRGGAGGLDKSAPLPIARIGLQCRYWSLMNSSA
jgi:hypothetical protein